MENNQSRKQKSRIWRIITAAGVFFCIAAAMTALAVRIKKHDQSETETQITQEASENQETSLMQEDSAKTEDVKEIEDKMLTALEYLCGEDDSSDDAAAFSAMKEAADLGNSDARYFAGEMYLQGIGTAADRDAAAAYFKEAVQNNNGKAFSIYAKLCFTGYQEVSNPSRRYQDFEKARELFLIAEQAGDAQAAYALGVMYFYGMCVAPDYNIAHAYFSKAAENGCAEAVFWEEKVQPYVTNPETELPKSSLSMPDRRVYENEKLDSLVVKYSALIHQSENDEELMQELESMKDLEPEFSALVVLYGKNDWLFYQNAKDGNTYEDYIGNPEKYFSLKEKENIKDNLEKQQAAVRAQKPNAEFYVVIVPNKESVYSEYMPSYVQRVSEKTRTDDLAEYLQANTDVEIIYVKKAMLAEKEKHQLYYYTDTHWNMKGTYVAAAELMKRLGKTLSLNDSDFISNPSLYAGDLGVMSGRQQRYTLDTVYNFVPDKIPEEQKVEKNALLIGDSFGEFLNIETQHYFKNGFTHKFIGDYDFSYDAAMKDALGDEAVDVVIWECAERYIDRLKQGGTNEQ